MNFGRVDAAVLDDIDFRLPADTLLTRQVLTATSTRRKAAVFVGCAKWGRKEWVGEIFPPKTPAARFLHEYVTRFNSVELNATHYKIYDAATIARWSAEADGHRFRFCPKVPQGISHYGNLSGPAVQTKTDQFLAGILAFGEHLGPVFLQMKDRFSPASKENLYNYLHSLPRDLPFFLELRHPLWFSDVAIRKEWLSTCRELGVGAVITDTAGRRDCVHMELPTPKAFIRFVGNGLVASDYTRVHAWVKRISIWLKKGLTELYFFMHQSDERDTPRLCDYVIEQLNRHCGTDLPRITFLR